MLVYEFLGEGSNRYSQKIALVLKEERWTYREIDEKANQVGRFLRNQRIHGGDRVAIFLDHSGESVISLFGILKVGAVFLMLGSLLKPAKLAYIQNNCQVKTIISDSRKVAAAAEVLPSTPGLQAVISVSNQGSRSSKVQSNLIPWSEIDSVPASSKTKLPTANIDLGLGTILDTSGSTGNPKGVMLTHLHMTSAATSPLPEERLWGGTNESSPLPSSYCSTA